MDPIYLDHAASTPLTAAVLEAMLPVLRQTYGNPSEPHAPGRAARAAVAGARDRIGELLGARPHDVVFTGGGTEADNLAVLGRARSRPGAIVTTPIEHPAVANAIRALAAEGREVREVPVDRCGLLSLPALETALDGEVALCAVIWANNVIGTIQPVEAIAALCAERGVPLHLDAIQAAAGLPIALDRLGEGTTVAIAAHKLGGPKGVGCLVGRSVAELKPVVFGGGHERGLRSGTENVPGIVGLAAALGERRRLLDGGEAARRSALRDRLEAAAGVDVVGADAPRLPGHACLLCSGARGDTLVHVLDAAGVCVAAGSACSSGSAEPSHVLVALGYSAAEARSILRVTLGPESTGGDVDGFLAAFEPALAEVRGLAAAAHA
jgi:cysteine desulfurase